MKNQYYTIQLYPSLSVGDPKSYTLMYKAALTQATRVVDRYESLWSTVIDSQLDNLDRDFVHISIDALTDDVILQNWEGSEILAFSQFDDTILFYSDDDTWEPHGTLQKEWVEVGDRKFIPRGTALENLPI